jgi:hypothetical protein
VEGLRFSVVVMAHPSRRASAERLRDQYPELGIRIVYDPLPEGPRSTLRTARAAWDAISPDATHHVVLQDDVLLCEEFPRHLAEAVATQPDRMVFLYTDWATPGAQLLRLAALRGACWAEAVDTYLPMQAAVFPVAVVRRLVEFVDARPDLEPDDAVVLRRFLKTHEIVGLSCIPSLVEHVGLPSLLNHDVLVGARRSVCFGPEPGHTWTDSAVERVDLIPDFTAGRSLCWRRNGIDPAEWIGESSFEWLSGRGFTLGDLVGDFSEFVNRSTSVAAVRAILSDSLLFQLWMTGLLYGIAHATVKDAGALPARSLSTLVGGGLREVLSMERIEAAGAALTPLFLQAMNRGLVLNADREVLTAL